MRKKKKRGLFSWLEFIQKNKTKKTIENLQSTKETISVTLIKNQANNQKEKYNILEKIENIEEKHINPEVIFSTVENDKNGQFSLPKLKDMKDDISVEKNKNKTSEYNLSSSKFPGKNESIEFLVENSSTLIRNKDYSSSRKIKNSSVSSEEEKCIQTNIIKEVSSLPVVNIQKSFKEDKYFVRLKQSLVKTSENLGSGFLSLFRGKKINDVLFEELEEKLLIADVGVKTTHHIITNIVQKISHKQLNNSEILYALLKDEMAEIIYKVEKPLEIVSDKKPFVILMVGVNGVGKTTTIGKLAYQYQMQGKSVILAAGDTFRAASVEQLQAWGGKSNISVISQQHTGADSASVIFDSIKAAKSRNIDILIADTAGRLHNKLHLMEELKKIVRVIKKIDVNIPHEIMLIIDAATGQNAINQAKSFHEAVGLTGITLTKLDGTAKGGIIFSIADQLGIPIRYIGIGERIQDLRSFNSKEFIEALFIEK